MTQNDGRPCVRRRRFAGLQSLLIVIFFAAAPDAEAAKPKSHHRKTHATAGQSGPLRLPNTAFNSVSWDKLDGWAADDHAAAFATFVLSCRAIVKNAKPARDPRPVYRALHPICQRALENPGLDAAQARAFFEMNFVPARIAPIGEADGFITGYYEPVVEGSRTWSEKFNVPLYRQPGNLVVSGHWRPDFNGKGRVGRKIGRRKLVSYFDRSEIEDGALAGRNLEICWLKDPIDSFFAQIQGSTRVQLDDGKVLRLNYAATNGHAYTAVGRFLIERGIVSKEEMSMQKIREWMEANPDEGRELRRKNRSFVFFRETELLDHEEAIGAQGISLSARRSIAVDKNLHVYGTPFFLDAELPIASDKPDTKFRQLMIAQDTGGAIVGPARADIYFGAGEEPERIAGRLKHFGKFVMLIPRALDPFTLDGKVPLPRARPASADKVDTRKSEAPDTALKSVSAPQAKPAAARRAP